MRERSAPTIRSRIAFAVRGVGGLAMTVLIAGQALAAPKPSGVPEWKIEQARGLPPLVFVSRRAPMGGRTQIPGFGPGGRTLAAGGRLLVREPDGRLRSVLPEGALYDVSDPSVSWDARRIVFAGLAHPDSAWRLFVVGANGRDLRPLTRSDRSLDLSPLGPSAPDHFARYDDFDPCWLPDGRVVFASTRFPQISQEGGGLVSNLFVVRADGTGLERITTERNGAEEPTIDPRTGRIIYVRWFFNPYLPSDQDPWGLTTDRARALPMDEVDHWQAVSIFPDGDRIQLAAGGLGTSRRSGAYQPCVLPDGTLLAIVPAVGSMNPSPRSTRLASFGRAPGVAPTMLGSPSVPVASPAALSAGRVVFSVGAFTGVTNYGESLGMRLGQFGLFVWSSGPTRRLERVIDLPGTDELDPAPLIKRKVPPVIAPQGGIDDPAWTLPVTRLDQVRRGDDTFRFDDLNVFATGPVDSPFPDAPKFVTGARIRFFATLARPEAATGDTVVLAREAKLDAGGAVHESDIPGDVPMFEQLVDDLGHVLRSPRGPAHVPGLNFARTGSGTKCVGCHEGHSALPVPRNNLEARWFNASPSAEVSVSAGRGGAALIDRRAKGLIRATGWVVEGTESPWARLSWATPIEGKAVVLYAPTQDGATGTNLQVRGCEVVLLRDGQEVGRATAGPIRPTGTRIEFLPVRLDAIELRGFRVRGSVEHRPAVALAEIETIARLIE